MAEEVIEAESREIALRGGEEVDQWVPRFAISVDEAVQIVNQKREFMAKVMREDEHYGAIPGTGTKKVLLKPGAELLLSSMGLHPRYRDTAPAIEDWTGADHGGEAFFRYRKTCFITRQVGPGPDDYMVIAEGTGNCNSWEEKYRWRSSSLTCPECGKASVIKGKAEYGGGWLCFKKKDGCGAKFGEKDPKITSQALGKVPNPNIADVANTLEKMADKRALIAATLLATGCSDIFTQDVGDVADDFDVPPPYAPEPQVTAASPTAGRTPPAAAAPEPSPVQATVDPQVLSLNKTIREEEKANVDTLREEIIGLATVLGVKQMESFGQDTNALSAEELREKITADLDKRAMKKYGAPIAKLNFTSLKAVNDALAKQLEEADV